MILLRCHSKNHMLYVHVERLIPLTAGVAYIRVFIFY